MKNTIKFLGIIAFVAIIGFSMAACGDDSGGGGGGGGSGGLSGTTWNCTTPGVTATLTFTSSSRVKLEYYGQTDNGTYTFNGSSGTINWDDGERDTFTVNGNSLTMGQYTFTKTGGGNSGGNTGGGSGGTFTLTDIPSVYNGRYASFEATTATKDEIWGGLKEAYGGRVKNGRVSFTLSYNFPGGSNIYYGNETMDFCVVFWMAESTIGSYDTIYFKSVKFTNGSATVSCNNGTFK